MAKKKRPLDSFTAEKVGNHAEERRNFYLAHAGLTDHPRVTVDLFNTIMQLARVVERQQRQIDSLESARVAALAGYPGYD